VTLAFAAERQVVSQTNLPMTSAAKVIDAIVAAGVHPVLKRMGFKRSAHTFRRQVGLVTQIVNIQGSDWNSAESGQFTMNLGVYFPDAARLQGIDEVRERPLAQHCLVQTRIGRVPPDDVNLWWEVSAATDCRKLGEELSDVIRSRAVPWIERHSTHAGAREFCRERDIAWWSAIFALLAGDRDTAIREAERASEGAPLIDGVNEIRAWAARNGLKNAG
jgi:hypothetical protein